MRRRLLILGKLFGLLLLVYALLRLSFLFLHFPHEHWKFTDLLKLFYWGFRMDFASLLYINIPFVLYYLFADPFLHYSWRNKLLTALFCIINIPFVALNFVDLIYFKYNHRRSTVDIADVFRDSSSAFGSLVKQYWYVLFLFIVTSVIVVKVTSLILRSSVVQQRKAPLQFVIALILVAVSFGIARGFSARPIFPSTPLLYLDSRYQPLVNNSTFNFLYSVIRKQTLLEKKNYFSDKQLDSIFSIHHQYLHDSGFQNRNVVIFVLESFSKEFFKGGEQEAKMPFFDSLMQHSTVCNNAYGNALESNKGLPAILASFPDVMDEPIYLSNYSNIPFKGIGNILKREGYNTSFFMGAEYDHFGFARLCKMVGIDEYYSRDTYGKHPEQYDGNWGIYDEYFFQYFGDVISKKQQPFFSVLFNLSSHTPYKIPEATAKIIHVPRQYPHQDSKTYVDYCYRQLFQKISKQPWFNNTIFVFVADHGYRFTTQPNEILKEIRIPLFIYDPQHPQFQPVDRVVKQLDIVPTLLDKLNYSQPFTSFGTSIYRPSIAFSMNRVNGVYQFIDSSDFIGFDDRGDQLVFHYHYKTDPLLQNNLLVSDSASAKGRSILLKAFLQRVNNCLVNNSLE
jgi:phosphoglycerol transferase MdoB-like AlkP superfamily enzyme